MPVMSLDQTIEQPQVIHNEMVVEVAGNGQSKKVQRHVGIPVKLGSTPGEITSAAPGVGDNSREILASVGFSDKEINEMIASGVIGIG